MNLDIQEALDFAEKKRRIKVQAECEYRRKKRRVYYDFTPTLSESLSISTTKDSCNDCEDGQKQQQDQDHEQQQDQDHEQHCDDYQEYDAAQNDVQSIDKMMQLNLDDNEIAEKSFDDSSQPAASYDLLHYYTDVTAEYFCSQLLRLLRDSHTCKSHSNQFLKLIQSVLPVPNHLPNSYAKLLAMLDIDNYVYKKYQLCTICHSQLAVTDVMCGNCSCHDVKSYGLIYDMNVEELIRKIYIRLQTDIEEYRSQLHSMNDQHETNDIGFNHAYQQLLKKNENKTFVTILLHVDGVSIAKSSKLKMWLLSGSIIEIRPQLRYRRYNMVVISFWFGYKEPDTQFWLRNCVQLIKMIKIKGDCIIGIDVRIPTNERGNRRNSTYSFKHIMYSMFLKRLCRS